MPETAIDTAVDTPQTLGQTAGTVVAVLAVYGAGSAIKDAVKLTRKFKARRDAKKALDAEQTPAVE